MWLIILIKLWTLCNIDVDDDGDDDNDVNGDDNDGG